MNTVLGERLDAMAGEATAGLEMHHPSSQPVLDNYRKPRFNLAAAAAAIIVVIFAGWWFNREASSVVDAADAPFARRLPALFYEEPTPIDELPPALANAFRSEFSVPDDPPRELTGAHLVSRGEISVAVALDITGEMLCVYQTRAGEGGSGGGCSDLAGKASIRTMGGGTSSSTTLGPSTVVLVANDVVSIELLDEVYPVERNIAIIERDWTDLMMLRLTDGTTVGITSALPNPKAEGEIVDPIAGSLELGTIGCATTSGGLSAVLNFEGPDGFATALLTPTGIAARGSNAETTISFDESDAIFETANVDGFLVITATWETPAGQGRLRAGCGTNHIDLSDLR
ncbi:MAG: hypothetical protein R8J94_20780 [Acidimicrobiia bacterium]|nr:hypothetical protein [Acidimicrobiia bacterium]